jgi:hypothetical protein
MIRNCLGLTVDDLKNDLFGRLDSWTLDWLLDQECGGGGAGEAALAKYDAFSVYTAKQGLNYLNNLDKNDGSVSGADPFGFLRDNMGNYLKDFGDRECSGQNVAIDDLVSQYKPDPYVSMYPDTLSDSKKALLLDQLRKSNFNAAVTNGLNPTADNNSPYMILDDSERGDDMMLIKTGNLFGPSILSKIPVSVIENFDPDKMIYTKCFRTLFALENYFVPDNPKSKPIVTEGKLRSIRRLHEDVILPIYRFYYGNEDDSTCKLRIHGGLMSMETAVSRMGASLATRHVYGQSANFSLVSISNDKVLEDLRSGAIGVDFGVAALVNGIYITLPYTYENYEVRNVILSSPNFDSDDIRAQFL